MTEQRRSFQRPNQSSTSGLQILLVSFCAAPPGAMEEELQQLRDLVLQLRADNERLHQERDASQAGPSVTSPASPVSASSSQPVGASTIVTEHLLVVP